MKFETLTQFAEKVKNDETLQKKVMDLSQKEDKKELYELMKSHGVSQEEIDEAEKQQKAILENKSGELSTEELDAVSGGMCIFNHASKNSDECSFLYNYINSDPNVPSCFYGYINPNARNH